MPTIRFRDLVKQFGKPQIKSLWAKPENDSAFMRAVKQNRVLTLSQKSRGTDFGEIGFHQKPHAAYLIFPKPLKVVRGAKVVGVKYDLVAEPEIHDAVSTRELNESKANRPPNQRHQKRPEVKPLRHFRVQILKVAQLEIPIEVDALTKIEAIKSALEIAKQQPFDGSSSTIVNKVTGCKSITRREL